MNTSGHIARVKRAELLSSLGAGVLGAGMSFCYRINLHPMPFQFSWSDSFLMLWVCPRNMDSSNKVKSFASGGQKFCIGCAGLLWLHCCSFLLSVDSKTKGKS